MKITLQMYTFLRANFEFQISNGTDVLTTNCDTEEIK